VDECQPLACGCGLTGVLFAIAERSVERVVLVDCMETASLRQVLAAAEAAAPWALPKIIFVKSDIGPGVLARVLRDLPMGKHPGTGGEEEVEGRGQEGEEGEEEEVGEVGEQGQERYSMSKQSEQQGEWECVGVLAVHACGGLTDVIIDEAAAEGAALAAMPCCYTGRDLHSFTFQLNLSRF
jgi:hypothetical protein